MSVSVRIDIVSDVMCPWCAISYASLSQALQAMTGKIEADIHWQPFELNPDMPAEGQNMREHMQQKYGSTAEESQAARERITSMGKQLGLEFNFTDSMRMVNTFSAHQLLHWAGNTGQQSALQVALFEAHFRDALDVSRHDVLVDIARQTGLDAQQAHEILADQRYAAEVRNKEQQWQEAGIRSVPAVIFEQKYLLAGAQPAESYVKALSEIVLMDGEE